MREFIMCVGGQSRLCKVCCKTHRAIRTRRPVIKTPKMFTETRGRQKTCYKHRNQNLIYVY